MLAIGTAEHWNNRNVYHYTEEYYSKEGEHNVQKYLKNTV